MWITGAISIHAPRVGRDRRERVTIQPLTYFNPRAPCGARRHRLRPVVLVAGISIHAPRVGRDSTLSLLVFVRSRFQSTRPVWGATMLFPSLHPAIVEFQSTRPVWGATPRDGLPVSVAPNFNPRAPCGARRRPPAPSPAPPYFNPRAPCGARRLLAVSAADIAQISIHAPRVGRDVTVCGPRWTAHAFQSTRPVWGATYPICIILSHHEISIHAPRVGRDRPSKHRTRRQCHFNPRAPCGARPKMADSLLPRFRFQSTRPVWGATFFFGFRILPAPLFQSTRPVWGATAAWPAVRRRPSHFNPRAPCGARRSLSVYLNHQKGFQSTRPVWGATETQKLVERDALFQSTRPVWGATRRPHARGPAHEYFNPRAPCGARRSAPVPRRARPHFNPRAPCGARQQI